MVAAVYTPSRQANQISCTGSPLGASGSITAGLAHGAAKCERVLVKRPHEAVTDQYLIDSKWKVEEWSECPEYNTLAAEHHNLCRRLTEYGIGMRYQASDWVVSLNSMMIRDAVVVSSTGSIIQCLIRDTCRTGEPGESSEYLHQLGLHQLGEVTLPGEAIGSDFVWITSDLLIAALTPYTNEEGVRMVQHLLEQENQDVRVMVVDLRPGYNCAVSRLGEDEPVRVSCRLCNCLSVVKEDVVVLCRDIFPDRFLNALSSLQITTVHATVSEWNSFGCDIFALSPHRCLMLRGSPAPLGGVDDQIHPSDPLYRIRNVLRDDHQIKCNFIYLHHLTFSKNALNAFINPYKRGSSVNAVKAPIGTGPLATEPLAKSVTPNAQESSADSAAPTSDL